MSASPDPLLGRGFPRPPAYAWRWLQRSRPVLRAIADRLTGAPPDAEFLEGLARSFEDDAFTRAIVIDTIAEVAFGGRVPTRHPPGASWDRGLRWWAAALAGVSPREFDQSESTREDGAQADLFQGSEPRKDRDPAALAQAARRGAPRVSPERLALARTLRALLAGAEGDQVPASAIRQLISELEQQPDPDGDQR